MIKKTIIYLLLMSSLSFCSGSKSSEGNNESVEKQNTLSETKTNKKPVSILESEAMKTSASQGKYSPAKIYESGDLIQIKSSEILKTELAPVSSEFVKKYIQSNPKMAVQNNDAYFKMERGIWGRIKSSSADDNIIIYEMSGVDVMEHKLFLLTFDAKQKLKGTLEIANTSNFADAKLRVSSQLNGQFIDIKRVLDDAESGRKEKYSRFKVLGSGKISPVVTGVYSKPNPHGIRLWHNFKNPFQNKRMLAAKPRLFIIGWSGNGKIAYITENFVDGIGAVFYNWVIQDLVSDKILWNKRDTEAEATKRMEQKGLKAQSPQSFTAMFTKKLNLYRGILKKYGIVEYIDNRLTYLPWRVRKLQYNIQVSTQKQASPHFGIDVVKSYQVRVLKNKKAKQIANIKKAGSGILSVQALGFFKSPYENRAAVLVAEIQRGWEGPPHDIRLKFFGASLFKGFK